MRTGALAAAAAFAALVFVSPAANAQNADSFFFGDEAALASGAVVATGTDSGSLWYNPAGFGGLKHASVSGSASTFGLRFRSVPRALRVRFNAQESGVDLRSTDLISVPNAVVMAMQLGDKYALAGGLLQTARDLRAASGASADAAGVLGGQSALFNQRIDIQRDDAEYHVGGAFAAKVSEKLKLGVALFATYSKTNLNVNYAVNIRTVANPPAQERLFVVQNARFTRSFVGLAVSFGTQYEVTPDIALGATLRSPEMGLTSSADGSAVQGIAGAGGGDPAIADLNVVTPPSESSAGRIVRPARLLLGGAYRVAPRSWVEVGLDVAHGLPRSPVREAQQPQMNGRVGLRYLLPTGSSAADRRPARRPPPT